MSVRSIVGGELTLGNLNVTTINDFAYPPVSTAGTLAAVLATGNSAGASSINMNNQNITGVNNIALTTVNGSAYPPTPAVPTLSQVLGSGNSAGLTSIAMNSQNITGVANLGVTTINGAAYPPVSVAGTVVTVNNTQKNLTTGTPLLVSQVDVTAGTWTIDLLLGLSFPDNTTFLYEQLWVQNAASPIPSGTVFWTVFDGRDSVLDTVSGAVTWTRAWSFTYKFATNQTIYFCYQANFSGNTSTPFIAATPAGQYTMKATQIA
jgi:hypothetical protein